MVHRAYHEGSREVGRVYFRLEIHSHFKYRIAYVKYAGKLWSVFSGDYSRRLIQSLLGLFNDKVANVRIVVAMTAKEVVSHPKCTSNVILWLIVEFEGGV